MILTRHEQMCLLRGLPPAKKAQIKRHCIKCEQGGNGIGSIVASGMKLLGPIAKKIAPVVFKAFIAPWIKKKIHKATAPKKQGSGLRLAGDRRPRR